MVDGNEGLDTFDFDYDDIVDDQINAVSQVEFLSVVNQRQSDLALDFQTLFAKFVRQTGMICTLQESWAKDGMDLHRSADDAAGDLIHRNSHETAISQPNGFSL